MQQPQGRQKVLYKRPRRLNAVSIALMIVALALGYVAFSAWPVFSLRADVVNEMEEALPRLFKLNLLPAQTSLPGITELKKNLTDRLRKLGANKKLEVIFERDKKRVGIRVRFEKTLGFPALGKTFDMKFSPHSETDAARIEW